MYFTPLRTNVLRCLSFGHTALPGVKGLKPSHCCIDDDHFCRSAFQTLLKIAKLMFTVIGYAQVQYVVEALQQKESAREVVLTAQAHNAAIILQTALKHIPNPCHECILRNIASKLGHSLSQQVTFTH